MSFKKPSAPSKFADKGKWAEAQVELWLNARAAKQASFAFHRLPDARSARGALAAQPSDWITGMFNGHNQSLTIWLEAKETAEIRRLPKAKIGQYGKLFMFHLAGHGVRVVVYRSHFDDWVMFDNVDLFCHETPPTSFSFADRTSFATASELLEEIYTL